VWDRRGMGSGCLEKRAVYLDNSKEIVLKLDNKKMDFGEIECVSMCFIQGMFHWQRLVNLHEVFVCMAAFNL
jgi:hypothetical protein